MNFSLAVICLKKDGTEERHDVLTVTKEQLVMETLGVTVAEGKALLAGVQAVGWTSKNVCSPVRKMSGPPNPPL
ncbi:MAG TPA: hypothetical protein VN666_08170 [Nitrospira sp.]|nr:hypothetical protein [Nitrospira sp.]